MSKPLPTVPSSRLLIDEPPLIVLPGLATATSLGEAIILQQIHYWLGTSMHVHEGKRWVYNTIKEWNKQFPFWGESTIIRGLAKLEERGLVLTGNFSRSADRTKWYTIDYEHLAELPNASVQNDKMGNGQNDQMHLAKMTRSSIAENTTETTAEKNGAAAPPEPKGNPLKPVFDAFKSANLPEPYLEAGNARAAKTLLKTWSPDSIAEFWVDVNVLHLWGTPFEADHLTFGYVARNNLMEAWSTWKARGKPLANGRGNGREGNAIGGRDHRGGGREAVPGHPGAERSDAQGATERPMAKYNDGTPILRARRAERERLRHEAEAGEGAGELRGGEGGAYPDPGGPGAGPSGEVRPEA